MKIEGLETELYRLVVEDDDRETARPLPQLAWDRQHALRVAQWWRDKRHTAKCKENCTDPHGVHLFRCEPDWEQVTEGLA